MAQHSVPSIDDSVKKVYKPIQDPRSLLIRNPATANKYGIPAAPTAPLFNFYPSATMLSKPWQYKGVQMTMDDPDMDPFIFEVAQDDGGMDVGIGIPEKTLKVSHQVRWAAQKVATLQGEATVTIAVCKLKTTEPAMDVYTIVQGTPDGAGLQAGSALIGRFMVQEAVARTYVGAYANPVVGQAAGTFRNVSDPPTFDVLKQRFQGSDTGKFLYQEVEKVASDGVRAFNAKGYGEALASFQWASVIGFFTHNNADQYTMLKNLASAWEKYLLSENVLNMSIPLHWANEAKKVNDTKQVRDQIARMVAAHKDD